MKNILFLIFLICRATSANAETVEVDGVRYFTHVSTTLEDYQVDGTYYDMYSCTSSDYVKLHNINCVEILSTTRGCPTNCVLCSPLDTNKCLECYSGDDTLFIFGSSTICLKRGTCPENATCSGTTITCNSGYTELNGACVAKVLDDAPILCRSGYTEVNGECVKDETTTPVKSCPPEMTLSDDGCCCLN